MFIIEIIIVVKQVVFKFCFVNFFFVLQRIILWESLCIKNLIIEKENQENIVERLEVYIVNKKLQLLRIKKEDEDSNLQKDVFEESF